MESIFFFKKWRVHQPLIFVTLLKEIDDAQSRDRSCVVDGIKFTVLHEPEKTTQETSAQWFLLFSTNEKIQVPKSLHYQAKNRIVNWKEEEKRHFPLPLMNGTASGQKKEHTFLT